jgi:hypothetical protein
MLSPIPGHEAVLREPPRLLATPVKFFNLTVNATE